jgi:hypothetical protein
MPGPRLSSEQKSDIRLMYRTFRSCKKVADVSGYWPSTIYRVVAGSERIKMRTVGRPRKGMA